MSEPAPKPSPFCGSGKYMETVRTAYVVPYLESIADGWDADITAAIQENASPQTIFCNSLIALGFRNAIHHLKMLAEREGDKGDQ